MKKLTSLLMLLFLINLGCKDGYFSGTEWEVDIPYQMKPVVSGYIYPNSIIALIKISFNKPLNAEEEINYPDFESIEMSLSNNQGEKHDFWYDFRIDAYGNNNSATYRVDIPKDFIKGGETYFLDLNIPALGSYSAETTLPKNSKPYNLLEHSINEGFYALIDSINDPFSLAIFENNIFTDSFYHDYNYRNSLSIILDDRNEDGQLLVKRDYYGQDQLDEYIANLEPSYYQYLFELNKRIYETSDPFTNYSAIPTNIEGGLGYFGSLNYDPDEGDNY